MEASEKQVAETLDEELARLAKALGHAHRVAILRFLRSCAACICGDIVEQMPIAQSTVSQHLKKLKAAGWIDGEIEGPRTCYCINDAALARFRELIEILERPTVYKTGRETMEPTEDVRTVVRERYAQAAENSGSLCGCGGTCCGGAQDVDAVAQKIGYKLEDLKDVPAGANLGLGCGNPLEYAQVKPGETVLDLGCGAGFDCFLASREVGPEGHVIGVDMTPQMLEKARHNAAKTECTNTEFRLGEIEHLPVADNSVDVIISNCVINLSPDKPRVFGEALRVLKPGGRLLVSDLVLRRPLSEKLKNSVEAYVGCVAGASMKEDYLTLMQEAGFRNITIVDQSVYDVGLEVIGDDLRTEALEAVVSIKVRAVK
ncbi:MAG TPA: arsenite methyltransferase [bacterium]|jgi:SAM-dependent methyltransferase/DNA-binding transcriptional ArsR family regulator